MKKKAFFLILIASFILFLPLVNCAKKNDDVFKIPPEISSMDIQYLHQLAEDTWRCIDLMVDENTQLPYDTMKKSEWTSVTNLGLYVASVAAAVDMGYLSRKTAVKRLEIFLTNLQALTKWNGIPQTWNNVRTGIPASHDAWISTLDTGNYYAGLRVGRVYFPELKKLFSSQIDSKSWADLYNPETGKLRFGYNRSDGKYGGDLNDLGADSRLASFLAVATGDVPAESWKKLDRSVEERYGYQYLQPGWQGGGLFMQYISGLMVEEKQTYLGLSAGNFAYAQILHKHKSGYAVWGWSACEAPNGEYLGIKALKDEIVTPHASALAIAQYPAQVIANLRKLEDMGARQPFGIKGRNQNLGFRDSIDIQTGMVSNNYLVLDQCMFFLSLVNFLNKGMVVKTFQKDREVRNGYQLISDLHPVQYLVVKPGTQEEKISIFKLRDTDPSLIEDPFARIVEKGYFVKKFIKKGIETAEAIRAPKMTLDGNLKEWSRARPLFLTVNASAEIIKSEKTGEQKADVSFMWDDQYLYFAAKVFDNDLVFTKENANIWEDDVIELFVSPSPSVFVWGARENFQIGLAASGPANSPQTWAWFQDGVTGDNVKVAAQLGETLIDGKPGYIIEAAIRWSFLKVKPAPGLVIGVSPAVHFVDKSRTNEMKLNWSFMTDGKGLGRLTLQ